jgi:uncharacterized protein YbaR (Trm112 family)
MMISAQLLDLLRCPLDPEVRLEEVADGLECQRCRLKFPIREGIPSMVAGEAQLPAGCTSLDALPCRVGKPRSGT